MVSPEEFIRRVYGDDAVIERVFEFGGPRQISPWIASYGTAVISVPPAPADLPFMSRGAPARAAALGFHGLWEEAEAYGRDQREAIAHDDPLLGAKLKLGWAEHHLRTLYRERLAYFKGEPGTIFPKRNGDRTQEWWYVNIPDPLPDTIPLAAGDCIHNLRSTLDHIAYALARLKVIKPHRGTAFPITASRAKFFERSKESKAIVRAGRPFRPFSPSSGMNRIIDLQPGAQAFVERLQPYNRRTISDRDSLGWRLAVIGDLDNRDKHREITTTLTRAGLRGHSGIDGIEVRYFGDRLVNGAAFAHVTYPPDKTEMDVDMSIAVEITIQLTTGGQMETIDLLGHLVEEVGETLIGAEPFFT